MNNKEINYPTEFHSFALGVPISRTKINEWIKQCIKQIEKDDLDYSMMSSGNTLVMVLNGDDTYEVQVCPNRAEGFITKEKKQ